MSPHSDDLSPVLAGYFQRFNEAIQHDTDPITLVLRSHLFVEFCLERTILSLLPQGNLVLDKTSFTFAQKLTIVSSLGRVPNRYISASRNLNKVRNEIAHELEKRITCGDLERIGSPLGEEYRLLREQAAGDEYVLLHFLVRQICGFLIGCCSTFDMERERRDKKYEDTENT